MSSFAVWLFIGCLLIVCVGVLPALGESLVWRELFTDRIPFMGHRNWIAVVDSAYPAQSNMGVETLVADADQAAVLRTVLDELSQTRHVRPIVYMDAELVYVDEESAPGVTAYKQELSEIFNGISVKSLPHEQIIANLDEAGHTYQVLVIKTNMAIPYTSVFLQLDCKYWSAEAEQALRAAVERGELVP